MALKENITPPGNPVGVTSFTVGVIVGPTPKLTETTPDSAEMKTATFTNISYPKVFCVAVPTTKEPKAVVAVLILLIF